METIFYILIIGLLGGPLLFGFTMALADTFGNPSWWRSDENKAMWWMLVGLILIMLIGFPISALTGHSAGYLAYLGLLIEMYGYFLTGKAGLVGQLMTIAAMCMTAVMAVGVPLSWIAKRG